MGVGNQVRSIFSSTLDVFYPNDCQICGVSLGMNEEFICLSCQYDLPYITTNMDEVTKLNKLFWGRAEVEQVHSLFQYSADNQVRKLLHQIKYKSKTRMATHFGSALGHQIHDDSIDAIIPVPLHPKKERKRGYNQSYVIAKGLKEIMDVPIFNKCMKRNSHNQSQTKFTKYDRWDNVRTIFEVTKPKQLENKHVLLVDDVLTTGATIEACLQQLLQVEGCKVSVATLAARL